ncbi:alpha/beta hydrolase family protein [Mariniblastus fucicola]|uniref:Alpha/beta hydrolase family protein n=1 Tax=Mariniblastus fucicola TaxID=980251 RepID=A0A5B9P9W5_9BACT|nr:alpha/beta hydrolase [Mariniblastus fucicola]QEG21700.1 Alpha/beta hydrolase family protein [Mariniblastus fucicola]
MKRYALSTVAIVCLLAANLMAQDATTTTWSGTLDANGTELRLEFDVTEGGEKPTAKLRSLDQNNAMFDAKFEQSGDSFSFAIMQLGAKFDGKLDEAKETISGTFEQAGQKFPLTLTKGETNAAVVETLKEAWVGKLNMGIMNPVMQFRVMESSADDPKCYFDSITEGATGFAGTWKIADGKISFKIPPIKLTYEGELNEAGDEATGVWNQGGRELPMTIKRQPTEYDSENVWENRPQRPKGPFPYNTKIVKFENEQHNLTLAGTLTIPKTPGKHPAVILISGSGPQDRDETLMEHKPFLVLADYLSRRGIAVLRYDDRGFGSSTGKFKGATTQDFATDASAAVDFLKAHDRIDANQIGLAGHSEGGLIAPIVCELRDDVAFVVLMAATGVDGKTIINSQTEAMLRVEMTEPEQQAEMEIGIELNRILVARAVEGTLDYEDPELKEQVDALLDRLPEEESKLAKEVIGSTIESAKKRLAGKWMKNFIEYDPRPALAKIKCPVLAIIGSKDLQVLPDLNMPEIEKALREGGNDNFKMVTIEGLNHLFQKCETGSMNEYITIQETWNPEALKQIGDWIESHVTLVE